MRNFLKTHKLILIFLGIYFLLTLFTYKDFGITADELVEFKSGEYYMAYMLGLERPNEGLSERHLPENATYLRMYPGILKILNFKDYYEWYHVMNMVFGSLFFIASYAFLYSIYKKPKIALIGPLFLFFTPRLLGDIPTNTKDMPFALFYLISVFLIYLYTTNKRLQNYKILLLMGIFFGITQSTRTLGVSLMFIFPIFWVINTPKQELRRLFPKMGLRVLSVFLLSGFVMIALLPILHKNTFEGLITLTVNSAKFNYWNNLKFYNGKYLDKTQNPLSYAPVWLFITIPLYQLGLIIYGIFNIKKLYNNRLIQLLSLAIFINVSILLVVSPVLYNGLRHFLFLTPLLALLAAVIFIELKSKMLTYLVTAGIIVTGFAMATLHPYEYIYFGEHVGGLPAMQKRFEKDYWGASYSEAAKKVAALSKKTDELERVYSCDLEYATVYHSDFQFDLTEVPNDADYIICDVENEARLDMRKFPVLFTIKRHGVTLLTVRTNE